MGEIIDLTGRFEERRKVAGAAITRLWDADVEPLYDYPINRERPLHDDTRAVIAELACKADEERTPVDVATQAIVDYHRAIAYGFVQSDVDELEGIKDTALEALTEDGDRVIALERSLDIIARFEDEMHSLHNPGY